MVSEKQKIKRDAEPRGAETEPQLRKAACGVTTEAETKVATQGLGLAQTTVQVKVEESSVHCKL